MYSLFLRLITLKLGTGTGFENRQEPHLLVVVGNRSSREPFFLEIPENRIFEKRISENRGSRESSYQEPEPLLPEPKFLLEREVRT